MAKTSAKAQNTTEVFNVLASLTSTQHGLLAQISEYSEPVTVTELAKSTGLHVSSVRETIERLYALGLLERKLKPTNGRGRPALGYITLLPSDPAAPAQMLIQAVTAFITWARKNCENPLQVAYEIGQYWGDLALDMMNVPDHSAYKIMPKDFKLRNHLAKIRFFLTQLGFAVTASTEMQTALTVTACPFTDPDDPDPIALQIRRGIIERTLDRTAVGLVDINYVTDVRNPIRANVFFVEKALLRGEQPSITVKFYGGSAEEAGVEQLTISEDEVPESLGELIDRLSEEKPSLGAVLQVSSFLVNREIADRKSRIPEGAVIDVLPPFAGG